MKTSRLPKKLRTEPIVDAVFEVQFQAPSAAALLPGALFREFGGKVEPLPASEIPVQIRNADQNLRSQPLFRLLTQNFILLIGDKALGIGCTMPYPGWSTFKNNIVSVMNKFKELRFAESIERYAIKYVNVIEGQDTKEQIESLNIDLKIGAHKLIKENFMVRIEVPQDDFIHLIQVGAPVIIKLPNGDDRTGIVSDIDTICNYITTEVFAFIDELPERLDLIHNANKRIFFDCLREDTIRRLGASYE